MHDQVGPGILPCLLHPRKEQQIGCRVASMGNRLTLRDMSRDVKAADQIMVEHERDFRVRCKMLVRSNVAPKLLPLVWRFGKNTLVEFRFFPEGGGGDVSSESAGASADGEGSTTFFLRTFEFYCVYALLREFAQAKVTLEASRNVPSAEGQRDTSSPEESNASSIEESECCLCMENQVNAVLPCAHGFCEGCLEDWKARDAETTCPLCR